ncbi:MAG: ATP-binding cassette domain-containing protein, partial [Candidatus Dormibacteraeota bacterium]|nr:ATP-binding cassette domain-containing protein [Candidatus Dormibacteraeota bacterium]
MARLVSLTAAVQRKLGSLDLDVEVAIGEGEVVALGGPNGAGKTTLLRAIAGLVPFESGHVHLDGQVLEDAGSGQYVPTE